LWRCIDSGTARQNSVPIPLQVKIMRKQNSLMVLNPQKSQAAQLSAGDRTCVARKLLKAGLERLQESS
jgi:hypothetical protein